MNRNRADSDMLLPRIDFTALFPHRAAAYVKQRGGEVCVACGVDAIVPSNGNIELVTAQGHHSFSECRALLRRIACGRRTIASSHCGIWKYGCSNQEPGISADLYRLSAIPRRRHPSSRHDRLAPVLQPVAIRQRPDRPVTRLAGCRHQRGRHAPGIESYGTRTV